MYWLVFAKGFALSASLIVAIGAQNAFLLRQAVRREFVWSIIVLFTLSDALLITIGVLGAGTSIRRLPWLLPVARWSGAALLATYGVAAFGRLWSQRGLDAADARGPRSLAAVLATAVGFTYLNPHVYLDTVLLVGSVGAAQPAWGRLPFALGATCASAAWFTTLGLGGRWLGPVLARKSAWRIVDALVAATMLGLAAGLVLS
jgi:L-lysine exporter family protein LysE/ArgO